MSVRCNVRHLVLCAAAVFAFGSVLWAQIDQGAIRGTVLDPSGAAVPGAKVTLTNEDTGLTLDTTTGGDGAYSFTPIKIGTYTVTAAKTGFQTVSHPQIVVHVNDQVKADFNLPTGQITQTVEVTSGVPLLQTQSSTVGQDLTSQQVNDLPLDGRNYTVLAQTAAGVTKMQSGRVSGTGIGGGGGGFTANGLPWSHNSFILDGIDNNNDTVDFLNGAAYVIATPPDAIQEVNVQTSNFNAEYGRAGSAVMNATTKSGTNQFHGDVWEYLRNDDLDASTWLTCCSRPFQRAFPTESIISADQISFGPTAWLHRMMSAIITALTFRTTGKSRANLRSILACAGNSSAT